MARAIEILVVEDEVAIHRMVEVVFRAASADFLVQRAGSLAEAMTSTSPTRKGWTECVRSWRSPRGRRS